MANVQEINAIKLKIKQYQRKVRAVEEEINKKHQELKKKEEAYNNITKHMQSIVETNYCCTEKMLNVGAEISNVLSAVNASKIAIEAMKSNNKKTEDDFNEIKQKLKNITNREYDSLDNLKDTRAKYIYKIETLKKKLKMLESQM